MRIRRARHGQIVWRQRDVTGVANSAVAVRLFTKRGDPIVWRRKPLAGTVSGVASESATLTDTVSALFTGSVAAAESLTLSDAETYPILLFAQTINRGRNPPIVWRQREAVYSGAALTGGFSDALTVVDAAAASQSFAPVATAESLTATDTNNPVGGSSSVGIVEAETVIDAVAAVWAFVSDRAESLAPVDAMGSVGGSPVLVPDSGGGGGKKKKFARTERKKVPGDPLVPPSPTSANKSRDAVIEKIADHVERKKKNPDEDDEALLLL